MRNLIDRFWRRFWNKRYPAPDMLVTGATVSGEPIHRFQALQTFQHPKTKMVFVEGQIYNVMPDDKAMYRNMKRWYRKGWVAVEQEDTEEEN